MKVEIYDPPMCCPTGICSPVVDPALMKMNDAVLALKKQGVTVERYNLRSDFAAVKERIHVMGVIHKEGVKSLPLTIIRDSIFKKGEYPTYEEICKELGIEPLKTNKPITIQIG